MKIFAAIAALAASFAMYICAWAGFDAYGKGDPWGVALCVFLYVINAANLWTMSTILFQPARGGAR